MLHIGANHLGNIQDTPKRVIGLIESVDYVIVEFEDIFLRQINKLGIKIPNVLIYKEDLAFFDQVLSFLNDGKDILILNEMGYPGIADNGDALISLAIDNNIEVNIIPGPSIGPVALAASGFSSKGSVVLETFNEEDHITKFYLSKLKDINYPIIVIDHKENMLNLIQMAQECLPDRLVCLCINLGWETNQKIIKKDYTSMINYLNSNSSEDIFGPNENSPVSTLVFGPFIVNKNKNIL